MPINRPETLTLMSLVLLSYIGISTITDIGLVKSLMFLALSVYAVTLIDYGLVSISNIILSILSISVFVEILVLLNRYFYTVYINGYEMMLLPILLYVFVAIVYTNSGMRYETSKYLKRMVPNIILVSTVFIILVNTLDVTNVNKYVMMFLYSYMCVFILIIDYNKFSIFGQILSTAMSVSIISILYDSLRGSDIIIYLFVLLVMISNYLFITFSKD